MKSLQDVVYNWLTIKLVADNRPEDQAAVDTQQLFWEMLKNEHHLKDVIVDKQEDMYAVTCILEEKERFFRFPLELIECIHDQIQHEPEKYQIYE